MNLDILLSNLFRQKPYYANLIYQMKVVYVEHNFIAAISLTKNGFQLLLNKEKMKKHTIQEQIAILEHECLHLLMNHIGRKNNKYTQIENNICADIAINQLIENLPKGCLTLDWYKENTKTNNIEEYREQEEKHGGSINPYYRGEKDLKGIKAEQQCTQGRNRCSSNPFRNYYCHDHSSGRKQD